MAETDLDLEEVEMPVGSSLSPKLPWDLANPKWAASINPLLANPLVSGLIIDVVHIRVGLNVVNHGLGRPPQGYLVIGNDSPVVVYDSQRNNSRPELTLFLNAATACNIKLYVF